MQENKLVLLVPEPKENNIIEAQLNAEGILNKLINSSEVCGHL